MQLRRFTSDSTSGALHAVREALGDEAVILSNRQVDGQVEIIATGTFDEQAFAAAVPPEPMTAERRASDDVTVSLTGAARETGAAGTPASTASGSDDAAVSTASREPVAANTASPAAAAPRAGASADGPAPGDVADPAESAADTASVIESLSRDLAEMSCDERPLTLGAVPATGVHELACEASEEGRPYTTAAAPAPNVIAAAPRPEPVLPSTAEEPVGATTVAAIGQVLANAERRHAERARRLERRFQRLEVNLWGELEPLRSAHLRQLVRFGVGTELAVRLVERLEPAMSAEKAMRQSLALLKATLPIGTDDTGRRPGVTVLHGVAGGGKTTALIKLATDQVRREGAQSVALISAGNRIGALESLQAYGRLLGVPVVQARDALELEEQLAVLAHKSLVLVDHLPLERADTIRLPRPEALGDCEGEARTLRRLLVLPATLDTRVFEAQAALHRAHGITHAVLTQIDRATRLAGCFGPLVRHALPLAYVSGDARAQMPLEKADATRLVATAMTAGRREAPSADEEIMLNLLQPTRREIERVVGEDRAPAPAETETSTGRTDTENAGVAADEANDVGEASEVEDAARRAPEPDLAAEPASPDTLPVPAGTLERIVSFEVIDDERVLEGENLRDVIETRERIEPDETFPDSRSSYTADWQAWSRRGKGEKGRGNNRKRTERT